MIETQALGKKYGRGMYALRDLNIKVDRGEFAFLTGPSGAGKSTLLRLLLLEERPTDGQVIVAAEGLAQNSDASSIEPIVRKVIDAHPDIVAEIRAGKDRKFQFLVGQVMKETRGKSDPKIVTDLMKAAISG